MGLFSSKKKVYVSSSSYNLAGDFDRRQEVLKSIIFSHMFSGTRNTYADSITQSYLTGPGIRFRNFERWSLASGYEDDLGIATSQISVGNSVSAESVLPFLPIGSGETAIVEVAEIGEADLDFWVDQYIFEEHPTLLGTEYAYDYDEETGEVIVNFEGGGYETFTPTDFNLDSRYLYVYYFVSGETEIGSIESGAVIVLDAGDPFPDTSDWTGVSYSSTLETMSLDTTVEEEITYSDATPPEYSSDTTTSSEDYTEIHGEWTRTTYQGSTPDGLATWSLKEYQYHDQVGTIVPIVTVDVVEEDIGGGIIKTTTTTTTTETLVLDRTYHIDEQEIINKSWSRTKLFIYKFGSGNEDLDDLFGTESSFGRFFPFIPLRLNNKFISDTYLPDFYPVAKKAMRKSTGSKFDELIENLADNDSIGDIDYAYTVFGVSLNARDNSCKKYLFKFFEAVMLAQGIDAAGKYNEWQIEYNAAKAANDAWIAWKEAQDDEDNPLFGTAEPIILKYPLAPGNTIRIRSPNRNVMNYDITMTWANIQKTTHTGLIQSGVKKGEVFVTRFAPSESTNLDLPSTHIGGIFGIGVNEIFDGIHISYQVTEDYYEKLEIIKLEHFNKIYGGKSVKITSFEALEDEEESGFIVPMHVGIWREMSLIDTTQMATQCSHLVLNSYQVVKVKWYQRGAFRVVLVIVAVVITVFTMGADGGATLAATLGLSGTTAVIFNAVVTVLAAIVLTEIVTRIAVAIFGEKIGALIGAIAGFFVGNFTAGFVNGTRASLSAMVGNLAKADNILKLTMAVGNGIAKYIQAGTNELMIQTQSVLETYEKKSKEIMEAYKELIPAGSLYFDPMMLTDSATVSNESPDSFLARTLMTGTDVIELSLDLINNYVEYTINTSLP